MLSPDDPSDNLVCGLNFISPWSYFLLTFITSIYVIFVHPKYCRVGESSVLQVLGAEPTMQVCRRGVKPNKNPRMHFLLPDSFQIVKINA